MLLVWARNYLRAELVGEVREPPVLSIQQAIDKLEHATQTVTSSKYWPEACKYQSALPVAMMWSRW